ncbi:hypothetical protein PF005_g22912 [Phytophthora fragariae]|uniref:Uncharacterized protein n=2 Tax=Phytophthora TaxID=4783 RepID=A0A6A3E2X3_9STRA|nr:hypothetical protein PF003_g34447 [Phytophthora fragariae]KAE8997888.1 hypothetical protein PR002_g18907 [Phytophthora rubi]KAE8926081.1 hypothetical protein PF009_g23718 [Phytophthora fragariae]KAE8982417.1 hypothetical protein PF011_g21628 [Phytophthora fragariae]KAE9001855.1 hypothetical protein PR001_g18412 [Phytophthora rubi]
MCLGTAVIMLITVIEDGGRAGMWTTSEAWRNFTTGTGTSLSTLNPQRSHIFFG